MYAGLNSVHKRLGKEKFPLVPQTYYPNYHEMRFTPEFPIVVKVSIHLSIYIYTRPSLYPNGIYLECNGYVEGRS